jgi:hypothetical protein
MRRAKLDLIRLAMFLTAGGATMNSCSGSEDFGGYFGHGGGVSETLALVARIVGIWI